MRAFFVLMLVFAFLAPAGGQEMGFEVATVSPEWRQASVGRPWMLRLEAEGAVSWEMLEGALPPGIYMVDASTVMLGAAPGMVLYGAPAEAGEWAVKLRAVDGEGRTAEQWLVVAVSLLRLERASATAFLGKEFEWQLQAAEGVAPFAFVAGEQTYLPLGLTLGEDGVVRGQALIAGRYEVPVEVRDAGGNVLKTTLALAVYGEESDLPAVSVRVRRDGCRLVAEWLPLGEQIEVTQAGGEGDVPLEVLVRNRDTGTEVRAVYGAPGVCEAPPAEPAPEPPSEPEPGGEGLGL